MASSVKEGFDESGYRGWGKMDAKLLARCARVLVSMRLEKSIHYDRPCHFVIFGATGDLSVNKLLPALYYLDGRSPADNLALVGVSRRDWNTAQWQDFMREQLPQRLGKEYHEAGFSSL